MIEIKNLSKSYGDNLILKDLNLKIQDGEFIVVLGPSGCGKTTLLSLLAGLDKVSSGEIFIDDVLVNDKHPKDRNISMVFQNYALFPDMNVYQNIAFGLKIRKYKKPEIDEIVNKIAVKLKIDHLLKRKPGALSGGEQQRVAIARAMVKKPKIFLFDEPLSNLDTNLKSDFIDLIKKLHEEVNAIFIYVTHAQTEALKLADRIVVMNEGKILQIDTPKVIYDEPKSIFVAKFLGEPKINLLKIDNYTLGIRPEKIDFGYKDENLNLKLMIDSIEFLGNGYIYNLIYNDEIIKAFSIKLVEKELQAVNIDKNDILVYDQYGNLTYVNKNIIKISNNKLLLEG